MADKWAQFAVSPPAEDKWAQYAATEDPGAAQRERAPRNAGQKVLDYATDTLSNVPSSAGKLVGGMYQTVRHPIDTAETLGKVGIGTLQKMTPDTPSHANQEYVPYADAAGASLKKRYGSPANIAETFRTDPVGVGADVATVAGGISGLARGGLLPRTASALTKTSEVAGTVSDIANPLTLPSMVVGGGLKRVARPFVKSALGLPGRTERYGATPAAAVLEETSGIRPATIKASANAKLDELNKQLEALAAASGNTADLTTARRVISDAISKVRAANGLADDLTPMQEQLTSARPGFRGAVTAAGDVAAQQAPLDFLGMKRQFGDDFTKFDAAVPLKDSARKVGNKAYHELSAEFNSAVPGAQPINQRMQSLAPVPDAAQRASERAGSVQRSIDRATRPTGAMAATLFGLHEAGLPGAVAAMTVQDALASPAIRMALARALNGAGNGISSPATPRAASTAGSIGNAAQGSRPPALRPPGQ